MKRVEGRAELRAARLALPGPVGFVPTMGYLHEGHLSLVRLAREDCSSVVVSIFVNPAQFGPGEDLERYPRDMERDLALLEAEGVDLVWTPTPEVVYPPGYQTWVEVETVSRPLEGAARPGHFRGVATVVAQLFLAVGCHRAWFGQKDAQQVAVIRRMVQDLGFPLETRVGPTVREPDGLAMSSRNAYLDPEERRAATVLFRALSSARDAFSKGERQAEALCEGMRRVLAEEPRARVEYVSCADPESLQELQGEVSRALLSMAVGIGSTRLVDNAILEA